MSEFSAVDYEFMARALRLAERGRYTAHPNPRVGCVLADGNRLVAEGWHVATGEPHAEAMAIAAAGGRAPGATAYVTLEPCAHHGRTPPCAEALIAAGVDAVVAAMPDPFPAVSGKGLEALAAAGIATRVGLLADEARRLNRGYLSRIERGRPFVTLKAASSLDGATAMHDGESQWITGPEARADAQRLRAASGAIMTGSATVLADDPSLTVRNGLTAGRQPLRVILDSRLRTPATAKVLEPSAEALIYCCHGATAEKLRDTGVEVVEMQAADNRVCLDNALADLAARGINDVLVEAGPVLTGALLAQGLVDEIVLYVAPHIMGSETRRLCATPAWQGLRDRQVLEIVDVRRVGQDMRMTARPKKK